MMKRIIAIAWLVFLSVAVCVIFWYTDLVYRLPTPIPAGYHAVANGTVINASELKAFDKKPLFLHFFNPTCPCSRFNITAFRSLMTQYSERVNFAVVVISNKTYTVNQIQNKIGAKVPIFFNSNLAKTCGVYSTPQVALLNSGHQLYYRGNYNRSRYCSDEKTNYAKLAIQGLLQSQTKLAFSQLALKAYGCQLPGCDKIF